MRYPDERTVLEIYHGSVLLPIKVISAACLGAGPIACFHPCRVGTKPPVFKR